MNLDIITSSSKQLARAIDKNSPTILTALGVAGLVSTIALAIKATPKAMKILEQEEKFRFSEYQDPKYAIPIDVIDTIELTWKEYVPTVLMGAATVACMIGSNHISLRRNAALASLFSITETTLREYQAKVVEQIGEKKAEKIEGEIAQQHADAHPVNEKTVIITGNGQYLCLDDFSGRYFRSDIESLRKAENIFNQKLIREGYLGINEFYDSIGLDSIELGQEMGWIAERNIMELKFSSVVTKSGEPALVVGYRVTPHHI